MSEQRQGWRAVPAALVVGLVMCAALEIVRVVVRIVANDPFSPGSSIAGLANDFALMPLLAIGAFRLARGLVGTRAAGARVFGAGCFAVLGINAFYLGAICVSMGRGDFPELLWKASEWLYPLAGITLAVGIAMLGSARAHVSLPIVAVVLALIGFPLPPLGRVIADLFGHEVTSNLDAFARAAFLIVALAIAVASRPAPIAGANVVVTGRGLRYVGGALWMRVIAAISLVVLSLLIIGPGSGGSGAHKFFKLIVLAAAMVTFVSHVWFAVGALQGTHVEVPQYALAVAGGCALWGAGAALVRLLFLGILVQDSGGRSGDRVFQYVEALPLLTPLVGVASIAAMIAAITGFARQRGLEPLRRAASTRGAIYISVALGSLALERWFAARSTGHLVGSLVVAIGGMVAIAMVVKLCAMAADELERGPQLPTARLRDPS